MLFGYSFSIQANKNEVFFSATLSLGVTCAFLYYFKGAMSRHVTLFAFFFKAKTWLFTN